MSIATEIEALLFASDQPLTAGRLAEVLADVPREEVEAALDALAAAYEAPDRAFQLVAVAGGWQLVTKPEHAALIRRLFTGKRRVRLTKAALESLAIIAYKQPIVKSEIEEIRGVETSGVVRTLLERKLVRIVGRKEVPGRPIMYGTTKYFLEHFGLNDLSQLPPLREFKELGEAEQAMLPMDEAEGYMANGSADVNGAAAIAEVAETEVGFGQAGSLPDVDVEPGEISPVDVATVLLEEPVEEEPVEQV